MKKTFVVAAMAVMCVTFVSCGNEASLTENGSEQTQPATKKERMRVKLTCSTELTLHDSGKTGSLDEARVARRLNGPRRAALMANNKALTDLYVLDYDKTTGALLQVLHQTSDAPDFAEPDLVLDYGEHTLKVIATRSENPVLWDAASSPWDVTPNLLTPVETTIPTALASDKTSDTFGAQRDVSVGIGKSAQVAITLERMVAKLVVNCDDVFPSDCSTIALDVDEHRAVSWQTMDVMKTVKNCRITDVSKYAGTTGVTFAFFFFAPVAGYTTDMTFTMNRTTGSPYAVFTVPAVPLERNKITTITGSFYNHQQGVQIKVNDEWSNEGHDIGI